MQQPTSSRKSLYLLAYRLIDAPKRHKNRGDSVDSGFTKRLWSVIGSGILSANLGEGVSQQTSQLRNPLHDEELWIRNTIYFRLNR
jgi:hypothetical protein